jgi:lysophospholipase L1-like esterase
MDMQQVMIRAQRLLTRATELGSLCLLVCAGPSCNERGVKSHASPNSRTNSTRVGKAVHRLDPTVRGLIVVLGSSTAAGIGPKDPNNAWVARYQASLAAQFPNVTLLNLAVGGQTTFEIQPSGYVPPTNRPAPVEGKNITAALRLNPRAVIVNLPSNDQANHYPLIEQLENYDRVATLARNARVALWLSTPQPRNFSEPAQIEDLLKMRDAITKKFAPRVLDFWTPFALPNGFIKVTYNAGDGTHLNDAAHAVLADIVEAANIPDSFVSR